MSRTRKDRGWHKSCPIPNCEICSDNKTYKIKKQFEKTNQELKIFIKQSNITPKLHKKRAKKERKK